MIIKKYQAKTEAAAMKQAREELGTGCVSLNVKEIKQKGIMKLLKAPYVEVTVALEEENETSSTSTTTSAESERKIFKSSGFDVSVDDNTETYNTDLSEKDVLTDEEYDALYGGDSSYDPSNNDNQTNQSSYIVDPVEEEEEYNDSDMDAVYELIAQTLIDNEVDEDYVDEIIDEAKARLKNNTPMDTVLSYIYQRLILRFGEPVTISHASKGVKIIFFVGTTGVGKTTTIAKIASKLFVEGNKVALFTSDTYRIAAAEQLRSYANILSVPFRIVYTIDDFEEGFEQFKDYDYILVDTVGHSHKNKELKADMKKFIDCSKEKAETEVYLVLAASTKMKDLIHIADSYLEISNYRLIFTKLDETYSYGTIFNIRLHTNAPMSYVTYGQNVPEDIDTFKPQQIVKKLLGGQ